MHIIDTKKKKKYKLSTKKKWKSSIKKFKSSWYLLKQVIVFLAYLYKTLNSLTIVSAEAVVLR